jgi:hypothetical protein
MRRDFLCDGRRAVVPTLHRPRPVESDRGRPSGQSRQSAHRVADLITEGYDADTVCKVARLLRLAEFKRRQAAPGPKVTSRNFARDRRYPVTNAFREEECK